MKLNNIELSFDNFASEMAKLKNEKHFDSKKDRKSVV